MKWDKNVSETVLIDSFYLLSGQTMRLLLFKIPSKSGRFSGLGCTFQGQKHGCKDY